MHHVGVCMASNWSRMLLKFYSHDTECKPATPGSMHVTSDLKLGFRDADFLMLFETGTQNLSRRTAKFTKDPHRDKINKMACAPSEDSDQPGHPPSLIRVFAVQYVV